MGCYLLVESDDGSPTGWDFGLAGDRQLAALIVTLPRVHHPGHQPDDDPSDGFRPSDFAAWRAAELAHPEPHNPGRFTELIDLLEIRPDCWVRISW